MTLGEARRKALESIERVRKGGGPVVLVGTATCGLSAGAAGTVRAFREEMAKRGIGGTVIEVGCMGLCHAEPLVEVRKPGSPGVCYGRVTSKQVPGIVERWLAGNDPAPELALGTTGEGSLPGIPPLHETQTMKLQVRRILARCGLIDPTSIDHYLASGGYTGLERALALGPEEIIEEMKRAGLRGRGGAGFPTWQKWKFCRDAPGSEKYLICNADEGDPGAFMNRALLEGDPHSVLEGMVIAALAIGARTGYIYCRAEYPLALERIRIAIEQMRRLGILGESVLGSGVPFDLKVKEGAGAFVCGEETALMASIEGRRGMPRPRPPFPAVSGLWGKPTVINNVESLASTALIFQKGAGWFAREGSEKSKGTKTFSLVGKVKRSGLVEVPLGITLRETIFTVGGGVLDDRTFKAVQTGGPSGGCIPASLLDTPVDYDSLTAAGTIMGSGGMVVMDERTCMVDIARYFLDFTTNESCGKCVPCRQGTRQMLDILTDITEGRGRPEDIPLLEELGRGIRDGSLCGLGQTAPNPVMSTLRYFRREYAEHIERKRCNAMVCKELVSSPCQHTCPIDTEAQGYIALIALRRFDEAYELIRKDNPLPSVCGRVCHHPCEHNCAAGKGGEPIAIRALKRFAADRARGAGLRRSAGRPRLPRGTKREKVAVVGSGPAGLSAAYWLAMKGHKVTIFESLPVAGGALAVCIPAYRLPRAALEADIQNIRDLGVKIRTGVAVGKDIRFRTLLRRYRAVFIATGAHHPLRLGIPGEDAEGVVDSMELLRNIALGGPVPLGGRVVVVGGGNAAVDAARSARRLRGCDNVVLAYRRTKNEMPAFPDEVEAAVGEGVDMRFLTAPSRVVVEGGRVRGLECTRMELGEPDSSGRRRPVPVKGSEFVLEADTVVVAIGERADASSVVKGSGVELTERGAVKADPETFATSVPGVFAGGDAVTGPATVIDAMGAGKVAARMMDRYLRGEPVVRDYPPTRPSAYFEPVELTEAEMAAAKRPGMPSLEARSCTRDFSEVETGLSEEAAVLEAKRCLRCELGTADGKRWLASRGVK